MQRTADATVLTVRVLWGMLTGDVSLRQISGPLTMAEGAGTTLKQGATAFILFLAIVSVSIGVLNLLPVPMLDGGQLLYHFLEAIKGSPLSERAEAIGQRIGIAFVTALTALALVRGKFNVDADRIYLMGHSMGGFGTFFLGAKHNSVWAGIAPIAGGGLAVALRDGIYRARDWGRSLEKLAQLDYPTDTTRANDGKCDARGRFWVGTLDDARQPDAALFCYADRELKRVAAGITVSNGLAWSPDGATMHWSDTKAHQIFAFDFDAEQGSLSRRRVFAQFAPRAAGQSLDDYGGRPDGAAMDSQGGYWVAMFEGSRLLRLGADGNVLAELKLPVRCATMPCFGGADLKTIYVTTAREKRPAAELAAQPWAGCVLAFDVDVPGLPVNFAA